MTKTERAWLEGALKEQISNLPRFHRDEELKVAYVALHSASAAHRRGELRSLAETCSACVEERARLATERK